MPAGVRPDPWRRGEERDFSVGFTACDAVSPGINARGCAEGLQPPPASRDLNARGALCWARRELRPQAQEPLPCSQRGVRVRRAAWGSGRSVNCRPPRPGPAKGAQRAGATCCRLISRTRMRMPRPALLRLRGLPLRGGARGCPPLPGSARGHAGSRAFGRSRLSEGPCQTRPPPARRHCPAVQDDAETPRTRAPPAARTLGAKAPRSEPVILPAVRPLPSSVTLKQRPPVSPARWKVRLTAASRGQSHQRETSQREEGIFVPRGLNGDLVVLKMTD
ncbi:uncharacterized protein LOC142820905 isoform X2 [Pelodiscus sinensis]|uniref:uncharacterized protein LOC142820905 isoform X2 n=1 Tax=Pelodiscus sinensis TaxID=13735 RepID=UPI003F6AAC29